LREENYNLLIKLKFIYGKNKKIIKKKLNKKLEGLK